MPPVLKGRPLNSRGLIGCLWSLPEIVQRLRPDRERQPSGHFNCECDERWSSRRAHQALVTACHLGAAVAS